MNKNKLLIPLLKVMLLVLIAITAFEYAKYVIFPGLTVFYSHIIGIGSGVMIVGIAAYMVQKKQEKLLIEKIDETERRVQFEASLRNAEEKYCKLFIESMDGVCQTTLDGIIVEANQAFCDILGGDAGGIIGESITRFYDNPEDRIRFRNMVEKNKGVKNYEIIQKRIDGQQIICSVSSSCCYSVKGEMNGYLTIVRDITEHKRAQEEERRNREEAERLAKEMAFIAEIGKLIGSTLDIDEVYERVAAEVRKLIPLIDSLTINLYNFQENSLCVAYVSGLDIDGRKKGDPLVLEGSLSEAVIRARTSRIIQSDNVDGIVSLLPRLSTIFQAGLRSIMCVPLISRNIVIGVLHFRSKTPNAYTENDLSLAERIGAQIAGAIANAQLFSDLKKAEKSLRESEGRFRGLVEQAAVGVAEIDMNTGRFLTVNRRLCEMVGRTQEEMLATTFTAITHPEDLHLHEEKARMMLTGEIGHYSLEKRYLRKDGETVWVNTTVSPLWKPGEIPGRNMIVVEDITDRKRLEEEILAMSLRDQMTELYNRRGFITLAEQQIRAANRAKRSMLLTFIDCDGLKRINDTFGHEEGDRALIDTAAVLRRTFRESDVIARLGGDEFAVLSIDAADINPEDLSNRFLHNISEFNAKGSRSYRLAMSWGTTVYDPESPLSLDELMSAADERMYAQKKAKPNLSI